MVYMSQLEYPYDVEMSGQAKPLHYSGPEDLREGTEVVIEDKLVRITKIVKGVRGASPGPPLGAGEVGKAEGELVKDLWEERKRELREQADQ
jgi:hypothetical protein